MTGISVDVRVSGPLFRQGAIDDRLHHHLRGAIGEVTDKGADEARRLAQAFRRTGRYQAAIRGRMGKRLRGKVMVGAAKGVKMYRSYIERGAVRRGRVDSFKGHHTIRRARQAVEPRVGSIVQKHVSNLVRELN